MSQLDTPLPWFPSSRDSKHNAPILRHLSAGTNVSRGSYNQQTCIPTPAELRMPVANPRSMNLWSISYRHVIQLGSSLSQPLLYGQT